MRRWTSVVDACGATEVLPFPMSVGGNLGLWELALLIQRGLRRVGQSNQFSKRIIFFCKRSLRFGIDDGQHIAAESPPDDQAVIFDGDNSILLVED